MCVVDRRRFARIPVFHEEAAVVHAPGRDIPIKIVDLSRTGLLFSFLEMSSLSDWSCEAGELLEISIDHEQSVLHLKARVVRRTLLSVAGEFEVGEEAAKKLEAKLRAIEIQNGELTAKARAAGTLQRK